MILTKTQTTTLACVLILSVCWLVLATPESAAPVIKDFSSTGGRTTNKTDPKDLMYLVKPGDKITFSVKAEGVQNYVWQVNKKVDNKAKGDSFTWTVPNEKGIWEIHVQAGGAYRQLAKSTSKHKEIRQEGIKQHLWGGAHQEWVVSTLSAEEAPALFEFFTDMKTAGRTETDPWGRKLPEWKRKTPDVSQGFARGPAWTTTESKTAYGTWRFRRKFIDPFYHQVGGYVGLYYIMKEHNKNSYLYGDNMDTHHHCTINNKEHGRAGFSIEYDGAGVWDDGQWRQVTIVRTRDGHVYTFRDDILEMHVIDPVPDSSDSIYLQLSEPINDRITGLPPTRGPVAVDCLEIYEGKYLFPIRGVEYTDYVTNMKPEGWLHLPVKTKGIVVAGRGTRLDDIAKTIDGKYFKKTGENTYTCYTNLIVDDGAELIIKDETLKFHCTKDGQWEFGQNFGSTLHVENSTITSDSDHYFTWNNCAPDTHFTHKLSFANPDGRKKWGTGPDRIGRLTTHDASGYFCFIAKNSTIRNTTKMYFDSPYVLRIENTKFENLRATDIGMYPAESARNPQTIYRRGIMGKKSFWVTIDDLNVHNFTLRGLTFTGAEPLEITFMTGVFRDRMNIYDVNV
ncbi:MAG: hypothetical protein SVV80_10705 [Planctomycetota bacterium]|nr:hypothetical protein [Planctomycetota bacterium]